MHYRASLIYPPGVTSMEIPPYKRGGNGLRRSVQPMRLLDSIPEIQIISNFRKICYIAVRIDNMPNTACPDENEI